ncbi:hypothetical protein FBUS_00197 [Fasciolopsis buskii]|uniref:BAR domain-containing protein n=1 Tax=Fasciolopsis buskii TaxID=27845 RepID=A0A8E0S7Z9_9TREM|nr:hypothetical protein FBUS_00197 [Fasciolopsis buski]
MDFKKFSSDANTFFNRALQKTEEAFKTSDKTLLDANLDNSIKQCEMRQRWASGLIQMVENVIQPNPAIRMEDMVLKGFDKKKERLTAGEVLGDSFARIGNELGSGTPHGTALVKVGQLESSLGQAERNMTQGIEDKYLSWLRTYVNETCKEAMVNLESKIALCLNCYSFFVCLLFKQKERSKLEEVRLDLDRTKTLLRRAKDDAAKKSHLEQQLNETQTLFNRQCDITRKAMDDCVSKFDEHKTICKSLLQTQLDYFQSCVEHVESTMHSL